MSTSGASSPEFVSAVAATDVTVDESTAKTFCKGCSCNKLNSEFIDNGVVKKQCARCRHRDATRVRVVDYKTDAVRERKRNWRKNNLDKVNEYSNVYRLKKREENTEEFVKHTNEVHKEWCKNHPEKMQEANEKKKNNKDMYYKIYQNVARTKNLDFAMSNIEYTNLTALPCFYCGTLEPRGFNGMDRVNQQQGYTIDNVVSCCEMCNLMKGCLSSQIFIKRIIHILTHHNMVKDGEYYHDAFLNRHSSEYNNYLHRAQTRDIAFEITQDDFENIRILPCYICGKKPTPHHINGVDRFNNNIGYTLENCRPCCGDCNYMKKDYEWETFISQLSLILKNHQVNMNAKEEPQLQFMLKINKKSKEELAKETEERLTNIKQQTLEKLRVKVINAKK